MDERSLVLDGNAAAGMLREAMAYDLTGARGMCANCGAVAMIGSQPLYDYPDGPGAILRCRTCDALLMAIVHAGRRYRFSASGLTWMEVDEQR